MAKPSRCGHSQTFPVSRAIDDPDIFRAAKGNDIRAGRR